jgi:limonene 1,2-monooxygenase
VADRNNWSLVGPVYIASSRKQAFADVNYGLKKWITTWSSHTGLSIVPRDEKNVAAYLVENGFAVIGTPIDAVKQIKRLQIQSGGFGTFLQLAHSWADPEHTRNSYTLFANEVMPKFIA